LQFAIASIRTGDDAHIGGTMVDEISISASEEKCMSFEDKVKDIRRAIAKFSVNSTEQYAIAAAVLQHFDFKQRMVQMEAHSPKQYSSLPEMLRLADGKTIIKEYGIKIAYTYDDKKKPEGAAEKAADTADTPSTEQPNNQ
jgi:hypothetical protein